MTLDFHPTSRISKLADVEDSVRATAIRIGMHSVVDAFVKFKPAGGDGDIVIGNHVTVNSGCVLYTGNGISIGNGVLVAANCVFAPTNHEFSSRELPISQQGFMPSRGGIVVEDDVWLGAGVVLLDGTHIGRGAVIGALSLVRGRVEPYSICSGNPLKQRGWRK